MSFFLIRVVRDVAGHFPVRASEWVLGAVLAGWGWTLMLPAQTFSISSSFDLLLRVMPETGWGLACIIAGLTRLVVLFINGAYRHSPHIRALTAFLSCFFWFEIALSIISSRNASPGIFTYAGLLVLDIYNVFRCVDEARLSDGRVKIGRAGDAGGK